MKKLISRTITPALLALLISNAASASGPQDLRFAEELDACVSALSDEINLDGVYRVRHIVTEYDARNAGYALRITTRTFAEGTDRTYASYCVASGSKKPKRLDVSEVAG